VPIVVIFGLTLDRVPSRSVFLPPSHSLSLSFRLHLSLSHTISISLSLTRGDMRCIQPCSPNGFTGADWNYYYNNAKFFCPPRGNQPFTFFFSVRKRFLCIRIIFHLGINMDFTFDLTPFFHGSTFLPSPVPVSPHTNSLYVITVYT